jgi:hypothetical protein
MARSLQLAAFSSSCSKAVLELTHYVHEKECAKDWLSLVEAEYAFLVAMARRIAEERKEAANVADV